MPGADGPDREHGHVHAVGRGYEAARIHYLAEHLDAGQRVAPRGCGQAGAHSVEYSQLPAEPCEENQGTHEQSAVLHVLHGQQGRTPAAIMAPKASSMSRSSVTVTGASSKVGQDALCGVGECDAARFRIPRARQFRRQRVSGGQAERAIRVKIRWHLRRKRSEPT